MNVSMVEATHLREWLSDGEEIALLDVRDGGPFSRQHLLLAANVPLARLETLAPAIMPRRSVRTVLVDDCDESAQRAFKLLTRHGWSNVYVLSGGVRGWASAGFEVFSGTNVPSKAFGEVVEHTYSTPHIDAQSLHRWQQEGRDFLLVDARPEEEFRMVSLPGAVNCPGAELVRRLPDLVHSAQQPVVVNCAGRTRSIIGAQSLRNAGFSNPVFALKNGTMGWQLAGYAVEHGRSNLAAEPSAAALLRAHSLACDVAKRYEVKFIERAHLETLLQQDKVTTYVFDVRLPSVYIAAHVPGSLNAPGGQLVQCTEAFAPVRHARIVLVDTDLVQSVMTAHWLLQMGWRNVYVLRNDADAPMDSGPSGLPGLGENAQRARTISPQGLRERLTRGVRAIDVGESYWYRTGRIPGVCYAMRSKLERALEGANKELPLVFVCADGRVSRYAAEDALALGFHDVEVLAGGRAAWRGEGFPLESCAEDDPLILTETDDMWYPPWVRSSGVTEAMQQYLTWEVDLIEQIRREPYLNFSAGIPAGQSN